MNGRRRNRRMTLRFGSPAMDECLLLTLAEAGVIASFGTPCRGGHVLVVVRSHNRGKMNGEYAHLDN